jgi:hypothetical protein
MLLAPQVNEEVFPDENEELLEDDGHGDHPAGGRS